MLDDLEITEPCESNDIKQAIVDDGVFEEGKRPSVKAPISDENKRPLINRSILRFNEKSRRLTCRDLCCGNEITERTETAFEGETGFLDHLCVEPYAGELDEVFPICARKIDKTRVIALNNLPATLKIVRR